ncbi:MAG: hypothetical protein FJZ43_05115 [Candidatus Staskawiczbacteria bacterium]|nr:hypothetical protein [Candidatus Staskawiczbacteria bacterium]
MYREVGDELVNCNDTRFDSTLTEGGVTNKPDCAANDEKAKRDACKDAKENTRIGQQTCGDILRCKAKPNGCNGLNENVCKGASGCNWIVSPPACSGARTDCSGLTMSNCINGCEWKSDAIT